MGVWINSVARIHSQHKHISNHHFICIITNLFVNYVSVKEKNAFLWAAKKKLQWSTLQLLESTSTKLLQNSIQTMIKWESCLGDTFRAKVSKIPPSPWNCFLKNKRKNSILWKLRFQIRKRQELETADPTLEERYEWQKRPRETLRMGGSTLPQAMIFEFLK